MKRQIGAGLLILMAAGAGCSGGTVSPTIGTISAAGLAGTWQLELLQSTGQGAILKPATATYTLTLSNGVASARADCNVCSGPFTLVGDSLSISAGLACTRALCPTDEFEAIYTRLLAGESTVGIAGSTMALVSGRGLLRFTR
ncbi:MAG TPA: META domain-containing protein [Vicinamibacterales bacterium]|nr:META domain-containing protein [Vicinamibacterales bacterium]